MLPAGQALHRGKCFLTILEVNFPGMLDNLNVRHSAVKYYELKVYASTANACRFTAAASGTQPTVASVTSSEIVSLAVAASNAPRGDKVVS